jgi:phosphoribosylanthranilate isomerase
VTDFTRGRTFVKICGITSLDDARMVAESGADAIGLIFAESTRQLSLEQAALISRAVQGSIVRVGVFRHHATDFVVRAVDEVGVDVAQIHGDLDGELVDALRRRGVGIIKALSVDDDEFSDFDERDVDAVLLDGPAPGSGQPHAWPDLTVRGFARHVIAAGGLTPLNVTAALEATGAWGVDVSSGVESAPGQKDPSRVRDFVLNARAFFERGASRG